VLEFLETPFFTRAITQLLHDSEYAALQGALIIDPEAGELIQGSGGLRKIRWQQSRRGKGKRGGIRVIYDLHNAGRPPLHAHCVREGREGGPVGR
jgi:hypothetical protein